MASSEGKFSFKRTGMFDNLYPEYKTRSEKATAAREAINKKWGRMGFDYDPKEAEEEAEALRREFREMTEQILSMEDPTKWEPPEPAPEDVMPAPASERVRKRESNKTDVFRPCNSSEPRPSEPRLLKKSVKSRATSGAAQRVRFGQRVLAKVRIEKSGSLIFENGDFWFFVGGAKTSSLLSLCASTMKLGDVADFKAPSSLEHHLLKNIGGTKRTTSELSKESTVSLSVEIKEVANCEDDDGLSNYLTPINFHKVTDISGQLGPGNLWKRLVGQSQRDALRLGPNAEVKYRVAIYKPETGDTWAEDAATIAEGLTLTPQALANAQIIVDTTEIVSPAPRPFLLRGEELKNDNEENVRYVERLALETLSVGERCYIALGPNAAKKLLDVVAPEKQQDDFFFFLVAEIDVLSAVDHVDCLPERPGAVTKRIARAALSNSPSNRPRETDRVIVRGLVTLAHEPTVVACAYGGAVSLDVDAQVGASWCLDDDASAHLGDGLIKAPLCAGLEACVKSMQIGEVADFVINAADLAFVATPRASEPPDRAAHRDLVAFHYSKANDAFQALDDNVLSKPLRCRLKLLGFEASFPALDANFDAIYLASATRRFHDEKGEGPHENKMPVTLFTLDRARFAMDDAKALKALGNTHYAQKAFSRAARRYTDAVRAVDVAVEAARTAHNAFQPQASALAYLRKTDKAYQGPEAVKRAMDKKKKQQEKKGDDDDAESDSDSDDSEKDRDTPAKALEATLEALRQTLFLNRAACDLKRLKFDRALRDCEAVLKSKPKDVKALYRSGLALIGLGSYADAKKRLEACLLLDANCADARRGLRSIREYEQKHAPLPDPNAAKKKQQQGAFGDTRRRRREPDQPTTTTGKEKKTPEKKDNRSTTKTSSSFFSPSSSSLPAAAQTPAIASGTPGWDRMKRDFDEALGGIDFLGDLQDNLPSTDVEPLRFDEDDDDYSNMPRSVKTRIGED